MALERCNCARCQEWTSRVPIAPMSADELNRRNGEYLQHRRDYREQHPIRARDDV